MMSSVCVTTLIANEAETIGPIADAGRAALEPHGVELRSL